MPNRDEQLPDALAAIRDAAVPLTDSTGVDGVLSVLGDASLVLLGEATHGTHEFYAWRARITQALIEERGFSAVAIEGDWPDAYRVNRFVQGDGDALDAAEALAGFRRFPTWMWRNTAVARFVSWLREYNAGASRVTRWSRRPGASDPEQFAEWIPFVETRDYVRAVVRNRAVYEGLYGF